MRLIVEMGEPMSGQIRFTGERSVATLVRTLVDLGRALILVLIRPACLLQCRI